MKRSGFYIGVYLLVWNVVFLSSVDLPWILMEGAPFSHFDPSAHWYSDGNLPVSFFFSFAACILTGVLFVCLWLVRKLRYGDYLWLVGVVISSFLVGSLLGRMLAEFSWGMGHEFEHSSPPLKDLVAWSLPPLLASLASGCLVGGCLLPSRQADT